MTVHADANAAPIDLILPGWSVEGLRLGAPVLVRVRPLATNVAPLCPRSHEHGLRSGPVVRFGYAVSRAIEAPVAGVPVELEVRLARLRCTACRTTFLEAAPELAPGARMTLRCAAYLEEQLELVPVRVVADELAIPVSTLHGIAATMRPADRAPSDLGWDRVADLTICGLCLRRLPRAAAVASRVNLFALRSRRTVDALVCPTCAAEGAAFWLKPRTKQE